MLETFTEAQPADGAEDAATVSSPDMDRLNQEADVASTALRHAEDEAAAGLSVFGKPVIVEDLDMQAQIRDLTRHMDDLRVQFQNIEDANKGTDVPMPDTAADEASVADAPVAVAETAPMLEGKIQWKPHWMIQRGRQNYLPIRTLPWSSCRD